MNSLSKQGEKIKEMSLFNTKKSADPLMALTVYDFRVHFMFKIALHSLQNAFLSKIAFRASVSSSLLMNDFENLPS